MEYMYMKLLSAVAKPTFVATIDNPVVGDVIDIILNDANKLTFEGTNPQVALVNTTFIPFIPGNGDFVLNASNNTFQYGTKSTNTIPCTMRNGTYTANEFTQEIAHAINVQGEYGDPWGDGLDINTKIQNSRINIITTSSPLYTPYFSNIQYWTKITDPAGCVVTVNNINNASAEVLRIQQNLTYSKIPSCRFAFTGDLNIADPEGVDNAMSFNISKGGNLDYISFGVFAGFWYLKVGDALLNDVILLDVNQSFNFTINGKEVVLSIKNEDGDVDIGTLYIQDDDWFDIDTIKAIEISVEPSVQLSKALMTTNAASNSNYFAGMTGIATSYIDWTTEALQILVGAGGDTVTGPTARPSVIICTDPPNANNSIGNVLVCLDMECGGHLSGPKTQAVRKFIYTIPIGTSNLVPCKIIAPFLLPIDLDLRGYTSISRMAVRFVTQIDDQVVGFTSPASITLAFLE